MTDFIKKITEEAKQKLDRFYKIYGEDIPKKTVNSEPFFSDGRPIRAKIINRPNIPDSDIKPTESKPKPTDLKPKPVELKSKPNLTSSEVSFENLSAKQIVSLVKDLTGVTIEICIKSKKNIIRHASLILKERGIPYKL